jgi:hypothetical protein
MRYARLEPIHHDETRDAYAKRAPFAATPLCMFATLSDFADRMNARNAERNTKIAALEPKIAQLEGRLSARIKTLEERPIGESSGVRWAGIWRPATKFYEGVLVTHAGSLWLLTTATPTGEPPGRGTDWKLICKKGDHDRNEATR